MTTESRCAILTGESSTGGGQRSICGQARRGGLDYFEARRRKRNVIDYNHSAVAIRKSKRLSRKPTISSR
jgi:hypothetical protein